MKILIVEDDAEIAQLVAQVLGAEGFTTDHCGLGADAMRRMEAFEYDVVLLDWTLPDVDGLAVCRVARRSRSRASIIMLTARGAVHERILGLETGADDYLVKPFAASELLARIRAILRCTHGYIRVGPLEIDRLRHTARLEGQPLDLTGREYTLLAYLARRSDRVVPRAELLAQVWGTRFDPGSNLIDVQVSRLRDKLGRHAWMVDTVRGEGYRLRPRLS